jgi:hypothetical protein
MIPRGTSEVHESVENCGGADRFLSAACGGRDVRRDAAFMKLWQHEEANAKLRRIVADLPSDKAMLPDAL